MHLVGFVIRIYHDARSAERQERTKNIANLSLATMQLPTIHYDKGSDFR